jgi:hypothetical protein
MKTHMTNVKVTAAVLGTVFGMSVSPLAAAEERRLVFVSPPPANAAFVGGLTGADLVCHEAARAQGLDGVFLAFLGDGIVGPANRFGGDPAPVVNVNGEQVAADWQSLAAGRREAPILQLDGRPGAAPPWTNVRPDGRTGLLATACDRWWSSQRRYAGAVGIVERDVVSCDSLRPFVCMEQ